MGLGLISSDFRACALALQVCDLALTAIPAAVTHVAPHRGGAELASLRCMQTRDVTRPPNPRAEPNRWNSTTDRVSLPPAVLRSSAPGYLLALGAALALGGFVAWKVVGQADSIHRAEAAPPAAAHVESATPTGQAVLVTVAPDATNTIVAPLSRLATTGATVPAPIATAPASPNATTRAIAPTAPATSAPAGGVATQRPSSGGRTSTPHRATHPTRATGAATDENPYDDSSPAAASKPRPAATSDDGIFDPKQ